MFFALMSVGIRLAGDLPSMEKSVFRNALALILSAGILLWKKESFCCKPGNFWLMIGRGGFGTIGLVLNFYANDHLNIADANVLNKLSPFMVLVFSAVFLKEKFKLGHLLLVLSAFCGCLFVVKPTLSLAEMVPAIAGVGSGVTAGLALVFVRCMGKRNEREILIVFYFSLLSTILTLPLALLNFQPFSRKQLWALLLASIGGCFGQIFITKAYHYAPAREISVLDYSQVLFSALFGYFILNQTPDIYSYIGYVVMLATGISMFLYNKKLYSREIEAIDERI